MFKSKNKLSESEIMLTEENERLKLANKSKTKRGFVIGTSIGVLLTLAGSKLVKVIPVDKAKDQMDKLKKKVSKKVKKVEKETVENVEDIAEEIIEILDTEKE